ncbi:DUF4186 family protein [Pontibacter sp. MBLB2868]|uniref:DUF4186 family protein n=1 Tax=Pontibacter sp. MBLB2868 TaxID=3451555 RepID=UPI003F7561D2
MESLDFDEPLPKVTCTSTDCDEGLHCFRPKRAKPELLTGGNCHACDVSLVDWENLSTLKVDELFIAMRQEFIREKFWTIPLSKSLKNSTFIKGRTKLEKEVKARLSKSIKNPGREIFRDGIQTPVDKENIIFYAQHATATCCRKCIKYWHRIPYDKVLSNEDLDYLGMLIMKYIDERVPNIPNNEAQQELNF